MARNSITLKISMLFIVLAAVIMGVLASDSSFCKRSLKQLFIDKCTGGGRNRRSSLLMAKLRQPASISGQSYRGGGGPVLTIREIIVSAGMPIQDIPHVTMSNSIRPENPPVVPPDVPNIEKKDSSHEVKSDIGFVDDFEEKFELLDEIFERFARSIDARNCCDNMAHCYQNFEAPCPDD